MYVLYTSKVSRELTAISSALVLDVTAMKSSSNIRPAPPFPSKATAAAGALSPAPF
jgi:hypothetical protein